ncbi:uncharacterized protein LOC134264692 [Saccostrea cucullata]|uniref:uncharacterized protein LOC134264692 n=1 Tax=Saccostrea cuccullata TaxID=36930 RepID=UPI002ED306FD
MALSTSLDIELGIQGMSEFVFMGLCRKVGTSQLVTMRRDTADISEKIRTSVLSEFGLLNSGSMREGFRLKGSDRDNMAWSNEYKVIWDLLQTQYYYRHKVIFANCTESPPGFALLQLMTRNVHRLLQASCIYMNGRLYISSSKFKHTFLSINENLWGGDNYFLHGPCLSGVQRGNDVDIAYCFASNFWPPSASLWIERCNTWPRPHVVQQIVKGGCHFVAIGHKLGKHGDNEWRISFSLAEQRLVYEMNHSQFLVYGLLKILTKELFHEMFGDDGKLLCSYHMKTAVFWVIQQNTIPYWCTQNLLQCFWVCFKLVLKWVYEGVCPNFFIPENNMFLHNIYGEVQKNLFNNLYALYQKGIAFLLLSPSINPFIRFALYNPRLRICTDESIVISEAEFDLQLFNSMNDYKEYNADLLFCVKYLNAVEQLIGSRMTKYQVVILQRLTADILQMIPYILHNMYINKGLNKLIYIADKISCYMVKLAAKFGFISDMLFIAMYYYKTSRYKKVLSVIEKIKVKLARPYLLHIRSNEFDTESYIAAVGGESWSIKMREAVVVQVTLHTEIPNINEFIPEIQSIQQNGGCGLNVGASILLHMLEVFCYLHTDRTRAQTALKDLYNHVHYGHKDIPIGSNDISLQILGICQQVTGNHRAALYSYLQSLRQEPLRKIHTATLMRIRNLYSEC